MTQEERLQLAARVVEKNRLYAALNANPDFVQWRETGPKAALEALKEKIVTVDRTNADWREKAGDMIIEYQGTQNIYNNIFEMNVAAFEKARAVIKEAQEVEKR